ncbi:MAG: amino acid ABC transporter permease [Anaerolineaceae bacterium]|nr:amino acid ABC transporter permease [Anaerolineaceae bacterium]
MDHNELPVANVSDHFYPVPEENGSKKFDQWWLLLISVVALIILLSVSQPDPYWRIILFIRDGIGITILTTVSSFILMLMVGLIVALGKMSKLFILRFPATLFVEIVRGIPLLVQLIFWYFAFPSILQDFGKALQINALSNYHANPVMMAIVGLTFCYAAYMSEIYRAGIQSIPPGQMEAAISLGMSHGQAMRYIILPQAIRVILPPIGNEFISLLKDSSLVSVVAVTDMTRRGREFMSQNFIPVQTWSLIALLYLVMTLFSARVVAAIERKTKTGR